MNNQLTNHHLSPLLPQQQAHHKFSRHFLLTLLHVPPVWKRCGLQLSCWRPPPQFPPPNKACADAEPSPAYPSMPFSSLVCGAESWEGFVGSTPSSSLLQPESSSPVPFSSFHLSHPFRPLLSLIAPTGTTPHHWTLHSTLVFNLGEFSPFPGFSHTACQSPGLSLKPWPSERFPPSTK